MNEPMWSDRQITEVEAKEMAETGWWKSMSPRDIVKFQLFQRRLCMDFSDFHQAIEASLKRSVFTHEFAMNYAGIQKEFLGEAVPPTFGEILELIPEDKQVLLVKI